MVMTRTSLVVAGLGALLAGATAANAQPGADQPDGDQLLDLRPPGEVAPAVVVRPVRHRALSEGQWGGGVRLTGLSGIGALPGVNIGAELAGFVRRDERFLELGLGHWEPQQTYLVSDTPSRLELALDVWTLRGGWASRSMPLRAWLLVESGEFAGTHQVADTLARMVGAVEKQRRWLAAGGGFGVAWPMADNARLVGTVELAIPIDRTPMMMMTGQPFESDAAAARCSLGLEFGWR